MSKFLKFIVGLILAVFIGVGAALIVPPFLGIDAVVVQEDTVSDMKVGTTIYAKQQPVSGLSSGTKILTQDNNSAYIRTVSEFDADTGFGVTDDGQVLYLTSTYKKAYFAIPYIGYLSIATQSRMGLIILLAILALTVVLFIVSEILRKKKRDAEAYEDVDDEEDEDAFYSRLAEKKRRQAEEERSRRAEREYMQRIPREEELPQEEMPQRPAEEAQFRDIFEEQSSVSLDSPAARAEEGAFAGEEGPADVQEPVRNTDEALPDVQAALEAALENQQLSRTEAIHLPQEAEQLAEESAGYPLEEMELAIPAYTADELMQKAYAEGKDPNVIEDAATGITLVDYSDCL